MPLQSSAKIWKLIQQKNSKYNFDWSLIIILVSLIIFGLTVLSSALATQKISDYQSDWFSQLIFGVWIGGGLCLFISRVDYHNWFKWNKWLLIITITLLGYLAGFIIFGWITRRNLVNIVESVKSFPIRPSLKNGALRWINVTFLPSFQPAELAKITFLVYVAKQFTELKSGAIGLFDLRKILWMFAFISFIILIQPDLGSVIILFTILITAFVIGKVPPKIILTITGLSLIIALVAISLYSYRAERVSTFWDFLKNSQDACVSDKGNSKNFQVCQARQAIVSGGLFGKGYNQGSYKQDKDSPIPEISTDAIFAVVGEEFGFIGALVLISLYLFLFIRGMKVSQSAPDLGGQILAAGVVVWILFQAFTNIAGITGLIPLKGITLPFISKGNSAYLFNMVAYGILINISGQAKKNKLIPKKFLVKR